MKRREFVAVLGSALAWPLLASGDRNSEPVVGFLGFATPSGFASASGKRPPTVQGTEGRP
jgi:hypothetical protein